MNTNRIEKTLTSDWEDLDSVPPKDVLQVGTPIGPYVVGQLLGHGGMGVVYEATHQATGARVALKTLHRVGAVAQQRLKNEFRSLCEVRHKNLVQLYELHTIGDSCFFTMEQIDGLSLKDYLTEPVPEPEFGRRIRDVFLQLAEGLSGLHDEGLLHLDLKPDNVIVTEGGVPRILDFGLVETLHERPEASRGSLAGTPRYMAPERSRGETTTQATDWYSFGVMLCEALLPDWAGPPADPEFSTDIPANLSQLCLNLMDEDAKLRPEGQEVADYLGYRNSGKFLKRASSSASRNAPLAGRKLELERLSQLLTESASGTTHWLHLVGESGVGKTTLTRKFRQMARKDTGILVLEGACHERESMPFQGVDGVLEGLARFLREDEARVDQGVRHWARSLEALSPAFSDLVTPSEPGPELSDPLERRRNAFAALKSLLESIAATRTIVIVLDDVQWGDSDGARVLAELLAQPTSPRLLLLTTSRDDGSALPEFVKDLRQVLDVRGSDVIGETMHLARLSDEQLLECLPLTLDGRPGPHREEIVRASRGLPFLARALGTHPWRAGQKPSLSALIKLRLEEAPPGALGVLRAVALSPTPLPQPVALETVGDARLRHEVVAALRHARLVRTAGESPDGPLQPYHALVAKTVKEELGEESHKRIRLRLARSLERKALASAELLANLFHLAGDTVTAARWALIAAKDAEAALAFDSAARWYGRAATWLPLQAADALPQRAHCLELAGRSAAAAQAYEESALLTDLGSAKLIRSAGAAWLSAGHVDRGLKTLAPELRALGSPIATSEKSALFKSMQLLWRLWRRGIEFDPIEQSQCQPEALERVDASWNAAKGLGVVMPMSGFALQLYSLLAALEAGEPHRVARSLAVVGPMFMGSPLEKFGYKLMESARTIATDSGSTYLHGIFLTFEAVAMSARWEHPESILNSAEVAAAELKSSDEATAWERGMAFTIELRCREQLGHFEELQILARNSLAESVDRDDLFAQSMAHHVCAVGALARCDSDSARHHAKASTQDWSHSAYTVQHYYALRYEVQSALLSDDGETARSLLIDAWSNIEAAQFLRNPISRPELLLLRGLVELAASQAKGQTRSPVTEKMAKALLKEKNHVSRAHGMMLRSACLYLKTGDDAHVASMKSIQEEYDRAGMLVHAACVELRVAEANRSPAQVDQASRRLREMGVRNPHRFARIHAPPLTPRDDS